MGENWYREFGLPEPETSENTQEAADPALTGAEGGANEQEAAEPAETTAEGTEPEAAEQGEGPEETGAQEGAQPQESGEMSPEERRQQAAARRAKAAQEAQDRQREEVNKAVEAAVAKARKEMEETFFKNSGVSNPYTGKPIESAQDWQEYMAQTSTAKLTGDLKNGKLTAEGLQEALMKLPVIRELVGKANQQTEQAKQAQERAKKAEFQAQRDRELAEIRKMDPAIQSVQDIVAMPTGAKFVELVHKGNSFVDAYRLANFDALQNRSRAAGEQAARNAAAGLQHQQRTQQQGKGQATVPPGVKQWYRELNPGMTDAEIAADYNKRQK